MKKLRYIPTHQLLQMAADMTDAEREEGIAPNQAALMHMFAAAILYVEYGQAAISRDKFLETMAACLRVVEAHADGSRDHNHPAPTEAN